MNTTEHFNKTVWCRIKSSPIHGVGVFAIRDIPAGTKVWIWDRLHYQISMNEFDELEQPVKELVLDLFPLDNPGDNFITFSPNIVPLQAFMNHADRPNTLWNTAIKPIKAEEEITENYSQLGGSLHPTMFTYYKFAINKRSSVV